jgi:hypothetical protein
MICAAVALLVGLVQPAGASTTPTLPPPPRPVHAFAQALEGFPIAYVPQNDCDPTIKRGTAQLGALLSKTYPGISWSSTRPCDGSVSEHHDGRAVDWMASVRVPWEHRAGRSLVSWLLASDAQGNRFAMARRLGVMYLIYNGRMWGGWDGRWEEYNGCRSKPALQSPSYDDYCHRSHVHISLTWNGAHARTTFWTGIVRATDYGPCPRPGQHWATKWTGVNLTPCR